LGCWAFNASVTSKSAGPLVGMGGLKTTSSWGSVNDIDVDVTFGVDTLSI